MIERNGYENLPVAYRQVIERECTTKQSLSFQAFADGLGRRRASRLIGIAQSSHQTRLDDALRRLVRAGLKVDFDRLNPHYDCWTEAEIVHAMQRWGRERGCQPIMLDWSSPQRQAYDYDWPPTDVVIRVFGTWNAAIKQAGFQPIKGNPNHSRPGFSDTRELDLASAASALASAVSGLESELRGARS